MSRRTRRMERTIRIAVLATAAAAAVACDSASKQTTTRATASVLPSGAPPGGGGSTGSSSATYTATGAYALNGGSATLTGRTITARAADQSGVLVKSSGALALNNVTVTTSGSSKSSDQSSFYGLDAGVLAQSTGKVTISGGSVHTTGAGANGVFAYGSGARLSVSNSTITATGQYAHGAMTSGGGSVSLKNVSISTRGASSAAIATDRGGGTITVTGGSMTTAGYRSPGIYSTGKISVTGAKMTATGAEAAVVEGANSITVTNTALAAAKQHGVMLYNSMCGDASAGTGSYTMSGGSLTAAQGPAFYVTNTNAAITLSAGARVHAASGVLVRADSAGTGSGNTGAGTVTFTAAAETLTGDLVTAGKGTIDATLSKGTTLTGKIDKAALTLDSSSVWKVTGNSTLTTLSDNGGISGNQLKNIIGNGHTVTYDSSLSANSALGGKTYKLAGGGQLKPA